MNFDSIGYVAAFCTTISFLPQAIKTIRSGDTESISLLMYSIFTTGVVLWIIYGVLIDNSVVTIANVVTGLFASVILFNKVCNAIANPQKEL